MLADRISVLEVAKDSRPIAALEDSSVPQESSSERVEVLMCEVDEEGGMSTNFSHEQFEEDFPCESADEKDEDADEMKFDAFVITDKTGECIHSSLANKFDEGLLLPSDRSRLKETEDVSKTGKRTFVANPSHQQRIA